MGLQYGIPAKIGGQLNRENEMFTGLSKFIGSSRRQTSYCTYFIAI